MSERANERMSVRMCIDCAETGNARGMTTDVTIPIYNINTVPID